MDTSCSSVETELVLTKQVLSDAECSSLVKKKERLMHAEREMWRLMQFILGILLCKNHSVF